MKSAILFGVPHHSNLGDHAIAIAEEKIIKQKFPEYQYKEVAEENTLKCIKKIESQINKDDIIFIHGGGNLGNQYLLSENGRRKIIETFPENKIIVFPETMYFQNNEDGKKELEISKRIYNAHKKLYLMAREEVSYEAMKKEFYNNNVFLTPDIVTILDENDEEETRQGALFIIRDDTESNVDKKCIEEMTNMCKSNFYDVQFTDTAKGGVILQNDRKQKLNEMFELYRKSELVITDRLHGEIFAAITGTPCIAIGNYNHKIKASSKWFEELPYIRYINGEETNKELENIIIALKECKKCKYSNKFSIDIFDKVFEEIGGNQ